METKEWKSQREMRITKKVERRKENEDREAKFWREIK